MKKASMFALLALASMSLLTVSCVKIKGSRSYTPGGSSGGTTGSTTPGGTTPGGADWGWKGTAPLSVDIDGVHYQATTGYAMYVTGVLAVTSSNGSDTGVTVSFTGLPTAGIYNCPSPANIGFGIQATGTGGNWEALAGGKVKVISITDSTIEGQFYGTVSDPSSPSGTSHSMTNGYFKVPRH